jgi:uncharacterized protein Smg (DUF494 family)
MTSLYETSKGRILALFDWYKKNKQNRNEATTRLHLIDSLFFECLGWDKRADCIVEERFDGNYTDYTLICPRRVLIVEAKREGVYFDIPSDISNGKYKITTLIKDVPELGKAIEQVTNYCQQRGVPFACICNGHQMIIFIGSRQDGKAPFEGKALVFESFAVMVSKFRTLWDAISKHGILERNIQKILLDSDVSILPPKLSQLISKYPGIKNRNILQTDMQILADLVFEDIISSKELENEFLEKCYCQSGALSQYALISKNLLSKRYEALFSETKKHPTLVPAINKKGITSELLAESFSRRPILILGDVGVGKSMFFRHFINIDAKEIFKNAIQVYIDFGSKAAFSKDIRDFVIDEIERQFQVEQNIDINEGGFIRGVYHGDLIQFSKGLYGPLKDADTVEYKKKEISFLEKKLYDKEQHLIASLSHLSKGRKQQIVIFLDNADQRSDDVQQHVFIIAQSLATNWPVTVFLALRPETFHRSKQIGSMSAYHLKAFSISPPRIDHVIDKRLEFGKEITGGKVTLSALPAGTVVDFKKVGSFLSSIQYSLKASDEFIECIDNLAGGNVRLALELIKNFIGSGHIDTTKILSIIEKSQSNNYFIRLHEFLRTVIFGDNVYYDPGSSPICNLFDIVTSDSKEHFLALIILQYISTHGIKSKSHGFVKNDELINFIHSIGFSSIQIDNCLTSLHKFKLIETAGRVKPIDSDTPTSSLRITTVGAYHLQRLPYMFVYYDAISTDIPIIQREYREKILDVEYISDRIERGEVLLSYLNSCADQSLPPESGIEWGKMVQETRFNIKFIKQVLERKE